MYGVFSRGCVTLSEVIIIFFFNDEDAVSVFIAPCSAKLIDAIGIAALEMSCKSRSAGASRWQ